MTQQSRGKKQPPAGHKHPTPKSAAGDGPAAPAAGARSLREMARLLERQLGGLQEHQVACCSVTLAQCHALVEVGRAGSLSLRGLAEILGLDTSTMSRTVEGLVQTGLVLRQSSPQDRRSVSISLTKAGEGIFQRIETDMDGYYTRTYLSIPGNKRRLVLEGLEILLRAFEENNA